MNRKQIRKLCVSGRIKWSAHAAKRIQERGIRRVDILHCLETGEIIEDYPDDFPYPSCLVYGYSKKEVILHVVVGCDGEYLYIITSYYPDVVHFDTDLKTRKER